jgi:hypothetical protein
MARKALYSRDLGSSYSASARNLEVDSDLHRAMGWLSQSANGSLALRLPTAALEKLSPNTAQEMGRGVDALTDRGLLMEEGRAGPDESRDSGYPWTAAPERQGVPVHRSPGCATTG